LLIDPAEKSAFFLAAGNPTGFGKGTETRQFSVLAGTKRFLHKAKRKFRSCAQLMFVEKSDE